MSMILTRSPLEVIGMNGAGHQDVKRRSARLSAEGAGENEPPVQMARGAGAQTTSVSIKEQDGGTAVVAKKKRKVYDEQDDDFAFSKSKRPKQTQAHAVRNSTSERASPAKAASTIPASEPEPKAIQKKVRKRLPTTPERDAATKTVRRSKRLSNENEQANQASPHKPAHAKSHKKHERSPSPFNARPVTIEKKRKKAADGVEEEKIMRIQLPFADTPVIKRNKEMRKASTENGNRRSSSGMRGKRASSLIDEGRGNGELCASPVRPLLQIEAVSFGSTARAPTAFKSIESLRTNTRSVPAPFGRSTPPPSVERYPHTPHIFRFRHVPRTDSAPQDIFADDDVLYKALPHAEVPSADFFKHISAALTEPRRMRCLLGWCGIRALPAKPEAPKDNTPASKLEFQALQAARVIQEELASDLVAKGMLSDWFSRDDDAPQIAPLQKRPNPRNVANVAKAEELERELERLKKERSEWDTLIASAAPPPTSPSKQDAQDEEPLSPVDPDLLDSPQRAIFSQLQAPSVEDQPSAKKPHVIEERLRDIATNIEFSVDQFAHGVHALSMTKETADRLAGRSLSEAADVMKEREDERHLGKGVATFDALKGLARLMNSRRI